MIFFPLSGFEDCISSEPEVGFDVVGSKNFVTEQSLETLGINSNTSRVNSDKFVNNI